MNTITRILTLGLLPLLLVACQAMEEEPEMMSTSTTNTEISEGMLQHNVYFYLNEDVTEEEKAQFEDGLRELLSIEEIYKSEIGTPGSTPDREVTDHSFGYSIFTWFETMDDYDVYAEHPVHLDFIDEYNHLWAEVKVYDSEIIETSE